MTGLLVRPEGTRHLHRRGRPGDLHRRRASAPTGALDPACGGGTGLVNVPLGPGSAPGDRRRGRARRPVEHDARRRHRPHHHRHAARRGDPPATRTGRSTPASAPRASPHLARRPRASGSRRWSRDTSGRILLAGTGAAAGLAGRPPARQRRPRHQLRQRRPHLPGARPAARRRRRSTPASTRSTSPARKAVIAGSAAGPGPLVRSIGGTTLHRPLRAHRLTIAT